MVVPTLSLPNTYTITYGDGDEQVTVPDISCTDTPCRHLINFTDDNRPSSDFTVSLTVSNILGSGQRVNALHQSKWCFIEQHTYMYICLFPVPVNLSPLVNLVINVTGETSVDISLALSMDFQGSTNLTVDYGICPNRNTFNMISPGSGMANDSVSVTLAIESDQKYCASIFLNQEGLVFQVFQVFQSSRL